MEGGSPKRIRMWSRPSNSRQPGSTRKIRSVLLHHLGQQRKLLGRQGQPGSNRDGQITRLGHYCSHHLCRNMAKLAEMGKDMPLKRPNTNVGSLEKLNQRMGVRM